MTGGFPIEVDHINRIRTDNRWSNLRAVTSEMNQRNKPKNKNNTSGTVGVYWHKGRSKWVARIGKNSIYLGIFSNLQDAIEARKQAEIDHGYHPTHGKDAV